MTSRVAAKQALREFLATAIFRGLRCVRIVHGKGLRSGHRGPVLKNGVNVVLRRTDAVVAFCSARPVDGGTGPVVDTPFFRDAIVDPTGVPPVADRPARPTPAADRPRADERADDRGVDRPAAPSGDWREALRAAPGAARLGEEFARWGIPTAAATATSAGSQGTTGRTRSQHNNGRDRL